MRRPVTMMLATQILVVGVTTICLGAAEKPLPPEVEANIRQRIDNGWTVGIVVATVSPESTSYYTFGHPMKGSEKPLDKKTIFEIGSITKVFTATLFEQLVEEGKVKPDDPIEKYLPAGIKASQFNGKHVTLGSLATHTSGLPRLPDNFEPKDPNDPYADYTAKRLYDFLSECKIEREIGSKYDYSNLGMGLLGHLLTRATGQSYEQLVVERISKPLGMADTCVNLSAEQKARFAKGYQDNREVPPWGLDSLAGAGALRSTAEDMARFVAACMGARETKITSTLKNTYKNQRPTGEEDLRVGLAWHVFTKYGAEIVWHNGGTGGYHSWCGFRPDKKIGAAVLSNSTHDIDDIGLHLLEPQWELEKIRKAIKLAPEVLERYVGYYELMPGVVFHVTRDGGQLLAQLTGQDRCSVYPESELEFFYRVVDAQLTFVKNDKGQVDSLVLHQNGLDQNARRLPPDWKPPQPVQRKEVAVAPAILESYVGQYELAPGVVFDVIVKDGALHVKLADQPRFQVFPESETKFFYKVVDAQLTFVKDANGKVTGLVLHQMGIDQRATKTK